MSFYKRAGVQTQQLTTSGPFAATHPGAGEAMTRTGATQTLRDLHMHSTLMDTWGSLKPLNRPVHSKSLDGINTDALLRAHVESECLCAIYEDGFVITSAEADGRLVLRTSLFKPVKESGYKTGPSALVPLVSLGLTGLLVIFNPTAVSGDRRAHLVYYPDPTNSDDSRNICFPVDLPDLDCVCLQVSCANSSHAYAYLALSNGLLLSVHDFEGQAARPSVHRLSTVSEHADSAPDAAAGGRSIFGLMSGLMGLAGTTQQVQQQSGISAPGCGSIQALAVSKHGDYLAVAGSDALHIWRVETQGGVPPAGTLYASTAKDYAVSFLGVWFVPDADGRLETLEAVGSPENGANFMKYWFRAHEDNPVGEPLLPAEEALLLCDSAHVPPTGLRVYIERMSATAFVLHWPIAHGRSKLVYVKVLQDSANSGQSTLSNDCPGPTTEAQVHICESSSAIVVPTYSVSVLASENAVHDMGKLLLLEPRNFSLVAGAPNTLAHEFEALATLSHEETKDGQGQAQRALAGRLRAEFNRNIGKLDDFVDHLHTILNDLIAKPPYTPRSRCAPTIQLVTVVTELLVAERALRQLKALYKWLIKELHGYSNSGAAANKLREFERKLTEAAERARAAQDVIRKFNRIPGWQKPLAELQPSSGSVLQSAVQTLPPIGEKHNVRRTVEELIRDSELLHEVVWKSVVQSNGDFLTPQQMKARHKHCEKSEWEPAEEKICWVFRNPQGEVAAQPSEATTVHSDFAVSVVQLLTDIKHEHGATALPDRLVEASAELLDALLCGGGLKSILLDESKWHYFSSRAPEVTHALRAGDLGSLKHAVVQLLYDTIPYGRDLATTLAERYGDDRTRIQHWLRLVERTGSDGGMLIVDEERVQAEGDERFGEFLQHLCAAYFHLAGEEKADMRTRLRLQLEMLSKLGPTFSSRRGQATRSLADVSPTRADEFLRTHSKIRWLYSLQKVGRTQSERGCLQHLPNHIPKLQDIDGLGRPGTQVMLAPGVHNIPLYRTLLTVQKLAAHASRTGRKQPEARRCERICHALTLVETIHAQALTAKDLVTEPLARHIVVSGLRAYAGVALVDAAEGVAVDQVAKKTGFEEHLHALWLQVVDLERDTWQRIETECAAAAIKQATQDGSLNHFGQLAAELWRQRDHAQDASSPVSEDDFVKLMLPSPLTTDDSTRGATGRYKELHAYLSHAFQQFR